MAEQLPRDDGEDLEDGVTSGEETVSCSSEGSQPRADSLDPILEVFLEMTPRKFRRSRYSRVPRQTLLTIVRQSLQFLIIFVLLANLFHLSVKQIGVQHLRGIPSLLTVLLVLPTLAQTWYTPEHTFTAWVSTEVHVFCLWIAWEFHPDQFEELADCLPLREICIPAELAVTTWTFIITLGITISLYLIKWVTLECVIHFRCCRRCTAIHWQVARRIRARPGLTTFAYRPGGLLTCDVAEFTYAGAVDEQGRPHGLGMWADTSFHGENLFGLWVRGRPAGCFTSRESGTGAQFQQRAVGYVTSRGDCQPKGISKASILPHKLDHLRYGMGQVEVSFAGGFFPFLPSVEHHMTETSLEALVKALHSSSSGEQRRDHRNGSVRLEVVENSELSMWRIDNDSMSSSLRSTQLPVQYLEGNHVAYVTPEALSQAGGLTCQPKNEALVFIHGYNCELSTALGRVAQVLALGNISPHVVPFVFSYSAGGVLQYFSAKSHMRAYGADLATFLNELSAHFEEVHILTHSCGAEFLFANWVAIENCFQPSRRQTCAAYSQRNRPARWIPQGQRATTGDARLHLATLTLMNPDVLVKRVVDLLPKMMQVAEHFTTYNDANDGALFWSGMLQTFVPRWYQERPWEEGTTVFGKTVQSFWVDRSEQGISLKGELTEGKGKGSMVNWSSSSLGSNLESWASSTHVPGDGSIDIINCSNIDQNVHNLRHNYYMLNTQMVEDVCELIGARLTASYRQRLCQVHGNIFNFLSPPSYLKE